MDATVDTLVADGGLDDAALDSGPDVVRPDSGGFEGDHAYWELLVDQPEHIHSRAYRSMDMILEDAPPVMELIDYDPDEDAARWTFGPNRGSMSSANQLRSSWEAITPEDGNALYYWEARWDGGWITSAGGIQSHKAFQIEGIETTRQSRGLETRTRFALGGGMVSLIDCRIYGWEPSAPGAADTYAELDQQFRVQPDTWTRFWIFVDWDNLEITQWVGDETNAPVRIYDRAQFESMSPADFGGFWFEFNSSQERSDPDTIYIWGRNLAVLKSLESLDSAQALVDAAI